MPRKTTTTKTTKPVKKAVAKKAAPRKVVKKAAPAPAVEVKKMEPQPQEPLTKKERMALQTPKKTWANVQQTDMQPKSWSDWSSEQLDQNKI